MELDLSKKTGHIGEYDNVKETMRDSHLAKWKFVLLISSVLVLLLVFLFMYSPTQKDPFADLKGTVYLTLALENDNAFGLYTLDVKSRTISPFLSDDFVKSTSRISPDGRKIVYVAAPLDRNSGFLFPYSEFLQVYIQDINSKIVNKLTDSRTNKRLPEWSPDGQQIVFTAQYPDASEEDFFVPDEWGIGVVNLDGDIERIDFGTSPLWSPDGRKLFYLKNDGFYIYNLDNKTNTKVWEMIGGNASTNMKLDISNDGSLLAWSIANNRRWVLFEIISWEPFQLRKTHSIDTGNKMVFWPVFSPDNRYLIFQEIKVDANSGELSNPALVIYNLETIDRLELISLDRYNFDFAFITDWR